MINVVNKYKHKSTKNDIYIGRGSALGNPFTHIKDNKTMADYICKTRGEAIENYREWLSLQIEYNIKTVTNVLNKIKKMNDNGEDVNLVCYCKPKSCHGDVIKEIILNKKGT